MKILRNVITHETAHVYDINHNKNLNSPKYHLGVSNSREWKNCAKLDEKYNGLEMVTEYASKEAQKFRDNGEFYKEYAEDFAESIMLYCQNPKEFCKLYPNRFKLIQKLIGGIL